MPCPSSPADVQRDPVIHEVGPQGPDLAAARHIFWQVDRTERAAATADAIKAMGSTIVFCRTRHGADRLTKQLDKLGVTATPIHGGRSQPQRDRALRAFARGEVRSLIATDVAARGVHVDGVAGVVHFDPPQDAATYVHRSGRTARAGATGVVVSLIERSETQSARRMQQEVGIDAAISRVDLDALNGPARRGGAPSPRPHPDAAGVSSSSSTAIAATASSTGALASICSSTTRTCQRASSIGTAVEFAVRPGRKGDEAHEVTLV